jgi:hypothetical protein
VLVAEVAEEEEAADDFFHAAARARARVLLTEALPVMSWLAALPVLTLALLAVKVVSFFAMRRNRKVNHQSRVSHTWFSFNDNCCCSSLWSSSSSSSLSS